MKWVAYNFHIDAMQISSTIASFTRKKITIIKGHLFYYRFTRKRIKIKAFLFFEIQLWTVFQVDTWFYFFFLHLLMNCDIDGYKSDLGFPIYKLWSSEFCLSDYTWYNFDTFVILSELETIRRKTELQNKSRNIQQKLSKRLRSIFMSPFWKEKNAL